MKTKIKMLGVDQVWHPKRGGKPGNRNALKTGAHTAPLRAWRREAAALRRRVRAAVAEAEALLAARAAPDSAVPAAPPALRRPQRVCGISVTFENNPALSGASR